MQRTIHIVGLGPGHYRFLSTEAIDLLFSGKPVYIRTKIHDVVDFLQASGLKVSSFDHIYNEKDTFEEVYEEIVNTLLDCIQRQEEIIYAVPGHPWIGERSVAELVRKAEEEGLAVKIVNGISFVDLLFSALQFDPSDGVVLMDAHRIEDFNEYSPKTAAVIMQVSNRLLASRLKLFLLERLPAEHTVDIVKSLGIPECESIQHVMLHELDHSDTFDHLTSVFVPAFNGSAKAASGRIDELIHIMATLRSQEGCPWDREQTHSSLKSFLIEEAYEVAEAVDSGSTDMLCEELGDVLLQIVFHAQIGLENGEFQMKDVIQKICEKMIRRHPHVFAGVDVSDTEEVLENWDKIKKTEKQTVKKSLLDGIPREFPALMKAFKIQNKAAKVGFDWDTTKEAARKVYEELEEVMSAIDRRNEKDIAEEIGDLLFAVVNVARFVSVEPETALLQASDKFYRRFRYIEMAAESKGLDLNDMSLEQMDQLWEEAKHLEDEE